MGYTLLQSEQNEFAKGTLYHYKHKETHCELLHIHNDDTENMCMFCVPSYPQNSTGVAHILEHTVLSGSQKYKVKEPFYKILKGSCKTFLNAMTYPDRTLYPVASTLKEDLFNLIDVYADAVWFPLIEEERFRQEGFHFLNTQNLPKNIENVATSGVVYNEMKGVYSDRDALVLEQIQTMLFPNNLYRFDSGGNPDDIPKLTYEQFVQFHKTWYRPELTKIIVYGNIPSAEYLDYFETKHFSRWQEECSATYEKLAIHPQIQKAQNVSISVPIGKDEEIQQNQYSVDITWALPISTTSSLDRFTLGFLHTVILGIPGSPLRTMLLDTHLAEDISNLTGVESDMRQLLYTIGLNGIEKKHIDNETKIETIILESLQKVIKTGIDKKLIEAALHRTEFSIKESLLSTSSKIHWLCGIARTWLYEGNVFSSSDPVQVVEELTQKLKDPNYLLSFAQKYLLDNPHRCTVIAKPDSTYAKKVSEKETANLRELLNNISNDSKQIEYWQNMEGNIQKSNAEEDSEEDIAALPMLRIDDLPKKVEIWNQHTSYVTDKTAHTKKPLLCVDMKDNGIFYMWYQFDITDLVKDVHVSQMLPNLAACFTDLGTSKHPYEILAAKIRSTAGRLSATIDNISTMDGQAKVYLSVKMSVLQQKLSEATDLLLELFTSLAYQNIPRLQQISNEGKSSIRSRVISNGTHLAIVKAALRYSAIAKIDDDQNGMNQLEHLLNVTVDEKYSHKIDFISKKIFTKQRLSFVSLVDPKHSNTVQKSFEKILQALPDDKLYNETYNYPTDCAEANLQMYKKAYVLPSQVAFNALVCKAPRYTNSTYSAYDMTARIVSSKLWDSIRIQYGAYGAGCAMVGSEGLMEFYTYRDPNIAVSYKAFITSLEDVARGNFVDSEIETLSIGMIGESLQPISPFSKGVSAYRRHLSGITDELRQNIRDSIFKLTKNDITTTAQKCLEAVQTGSFASFCSEELAHQQKETNKWLWDEIEVLPQ